MVTEPKAGDYVHYTSHRKSLDCIPGIILKSHPYTGEELVCFPTHGTAFHVEARQAQPGHLDAGTWHLMNEPGCKLITVLPGTELEGVSLN